MKKSNFGEGDESGNTLKKGKIRRVATWSFWLIAATHIAAFTAIGIFTPRGWRLLGIFLAGLAVVLAAKYIVAQIVKHNRP